MGKIARRIGRSQMPSIAKLWDRVRGLVNAQRTAKMPDAEIEEALLGIAAELAVRRGSTEADFATAAANAVVAVRRADAEEEEDEREV